MGEKYRRNDFIICSHIEDFNAYTFTVNVRFVINHYMTIFKSVYLFHKSELIKDLYVTHSGKTGLIIFKKKKKKRLVPISQYLVALELEFVVLLYRRHAGEL